MDCRQAGRCICGDVAKLHAALMCALKPVFSTPKKDPASNRHLLASSRLILQVQSSEGQEFWLHVGSANLKTWVLKVLPLELDFNDFWGSLAMELGGIPLRVSDDDMWCPASTLSSICAEWDLRPAYTFKLWTISGSARRLQSLDPSHVIAMEFQHEVLFWPGVAMVVAAVPRDPAVENDAAPPLPGGPAAAEEGVLPDAEVEDACEDEPAWLAELDMMVAALAVAEPAGHAAPGGAPSSPARVHDTPLEHLSDGNGADAAAGGHGVEEEVMAPMDVLAEDPPAALPAGPPNPPEPEDVADGGLAGGRGVPWAKWEIDGFGILVLNEHKGLSLAAHCAGCRVRVNRTLMRSGQRNPAQGRPLGFLVAWLWARGFPCDSGGHRALRDNAAATAVSYEQRARARQWIQDRSAYFQRILDLERPRDADEGDEPVGMP